MGGGCTAESGLLRTPGGPDAPLWIWVRDRHSGAPLADARVSFETASRFHPLSAASLLGQTDPEHASVMTDSTGAAMMQVLSGRDFRIVVWAPGRSAVVFRPTTPGTLAPSEWLDPFMPGDGADPGLQVRISERAGIPRQ